MTSRERVLTALAHEEPDRVPWNLRPASDIRERFSQEFGEEDFADHFGHDVRLVTLAMPARSVSLPADDEWPDPPADEAVAHVAEEVRALHARDLAVCCSYTCGVYEQAKHWIGDDPGTQRSLVMSPAIYREWYEPRHQWIVEQIRAKRPDVKIAFHCCGHVTPLIPDLIGIGLLKREFGRDICFWGGVGAQSVLAFHDAMERYGGYPRPGGDPASG